jgi:hypothetical protein
MLRTVHVDVDEIKYIPFCINIFLHAIQNFKIQENVKFMLVIPHPSLYLLIFFLRTYDTFPTFSLEKNFQPPPYEEFLEINFLWYQYYTDYDRIINRLVDYTPDCQD